MLPHQAKSILDISYSVQEHPAFWRRELLRIEGAITFAGTLPNYCKYSLGRLVWNRFRVGLAINIAYRREAGDTI